ncbi:exported hypothetical protein [uncultured Desulfobacterium sp.]|uniref:EfeO-type cupredoxin-like domain-containing protein n=1 Tax=uncultured Desulfobacterium sp. TaxID=201089 RepID=A0A445N0L9_9BACT|nr:exported hypothetical protein [uncultured Desulfobacterium sp.]
MKKFFVTSMGILVLFGAVLFLGRALAFAETCQVVSITSEKAGTADRIIITPDKITVPPGSCVVFMNWVRNDKVRVSFRENVKECKLTLDANAGFGLAVGEECYLTDYLTRGKTASMYFTSPGVFKYTLDMEGKPSVKTEGVIEVK